MGREAPGRRSVNRRQFLYLTGLAATGVVATACGGGAPLPGATPQAPATAGAQPTGAAPPQATAGPAPTLGVQQAPRGVQASPPAQGAAAPAVTARKEAPQLAALVREGKLPPVEQRLPKAPLVVTPIERVGKYGGTWRNVILGGADLATLTTTIGYEHLVRWDRNWDNIVPNVAESYEVNADGSEFTFKLREGHKWSDGQPFTADDILFWYEDVSLNKDLNPGGFGSWLKSGGKDVVVEKVDNLTVKFKFAAPNGLFLSFMCTANGSGITQYPKHYAQQFHKKYNPEGVDRLAREANQDGWIRLFQTKCSGIPGTPYNAVWQNPELPTLHAWDITQPFTGTTRVTAERNPYYFKIDPEGNQLPYIDRCVYDVTGDNEVVLLKTINGELDYMVTKVNTIQNRAVLTDNQARGQYRFLEIIGASMNTCIIALNMNHKDPAKRQIFQNKDFRVGLSHAINRQEIIDVVFVGQGEPWQAAPRRETPFFNEKLAKQYTEYDVKKANEYLDKAFPRKDAGGIRLGPDGKPISFVMEVTEIQKERVDTMNLVRDQWRRVGVDMQVKTLDRSLFYSRKDTNEHDANVWGGDGGLRDAILECRWYFPFNNESNFAQAWRYWYNPPGQLLLQPEEPPEAPKRQMALYDQIKATVDEDKQAALFKEILAIAQDQFYVIGISLAPPGYGVVKNNMRNVPQQSLAAWLFQHPAVTDTTTHFFE